MKRFLLGLLITLPVCAFAADKKNISMVTYFPVPYVAYSTVDVASNMDIGLGTAAKLELGNTDLSTSYSPLNVGGKINVTGGSLGLRIGVSNFPGAEVNAISLGSGVSESGAKFTFTKNLRANAIEAKGLNADVMDVHALNLFGYPFPDCNTVNPSSEGKMYWAELSLTNKATDKVLFLTCGKYAPPETGNCVASRTSLSDASSRADTCNGNSAGKWTGDICEDQVNKSCIDVYGIISGGLTGTGFSGTNTTMASGMQGGTFAVGITPHSQDSGPSLTRTCAPPCKNTQICMCTGEGLKAVCHCENSTPLNPLTPVNPALPIDPDVGPGLVDITVYADEVKCVCENTPVVTTKTCSQWNTETTGGLNNLCKQVGKVYNNSNNAAKNTSSASACCQTCAEAYGSQYVWDSYYKDCEDRSFHETELSEYVRYEIIPNGESPVYTITDTSLNPYWGTGCGTIEDCFKNGGLAACGMPFLEDKYSNTIPPCGNGDLCASCDITKDSCPRKCYVADMGWNALFVGDLTLTADAFTDQHGCPAASGQADGDNVMNSLSFCQAYNGSAKLDGDLSSCGFSGCKTTYQIEHQEPTTNWSKVNVDISCRNHGVGQYWRSIGGATTTCTSLGCGSEATQTGNYHWTSGAYAISPKIHYNHSIKGCARW